MDIRRFRPRWLTVTELANRGGGHTGTIVEVREQRMYNPHRLEPEQQPVIVFDDCLLVPNKGMADTLEGLYGRETVAWHGRRICVFTRRVEYTNRKTGEVCIRVERAVSPAADAQDAEAPTADHVAEAEGAPISITKTGAPAPTPTLPRWEPVVSAPGLPPAGELFGPKPEAGFDFDFDYDPKGWQK